VREAALVGEDHEQDYDTSNIARFEHRDTLADTELDAVTCGADAASPKIYEACCKGTHIPEVTIELF
jgi:type VI protein secretion system component Hcp